MSKGDGAVCVGCGIKPHDGLPVASMYATGGWKVKVCRACGEAERVHIFKKKKVLTAPGKKGTR